MTQRTMRREPARRERAVQRWPQIEATTLADRVYQIVRNRILHRELVPGSFIREQEVSEATGVSRTPVREALNRLASQDFLERVPHRGFRVPDRPWEALLEIYPIVSALEMLAATLSFRQLTAADLRRMEELNRQLEEASLAGDTKALVESNNSFHRIFSDRSGNDRLSELLDQLRAQVSLLDRLYFSVSENSERALAEHEEILEALVREDYAEAFELLRLNYVRGGEALHDQLTRKNDLADR